MVAVDSDDTHLVVPPNVTVCAHDINDGLPVEGSFDVIHSRLVLMHLARRREILSQLVNALAPGGWLVVGDYTFPGPPVIAAPSEADAQLSVSRRVTRQGSRRSSNAWIRRSPHGTGR